MKRAIPTPFRVLVALVSLLIAAPAAHAAFPGTNGDIVFERDGAIMILAPGGSPTPLVSGDSNFSPAISPDGTTIAYNAQNPVDESTDIWTIRHDGTGATNLSNVAGGINADSYPAWSPDGSKIAFVNNLSGAPNVWTMNADGTNRVQITTNASTSAIYREPAWSPDGTRIAFTRFVFFAPSAQPPTILITPASPPGQPLQGFTSDGSDPSWSPDGSHIAFYRGPGGTRDVYVGQFIPGQLTPEPPLAITSQDGDSTPFWDDYSPAFSPDESRILFVSDRSGVAALHSAVATGTNQGVQPVTTPPGSFGDAFPDWGPLRAVAPVDPVAPAQCSDGQDNDGDGQTDLADPGCTSAADNDEANAIIVPGLTPPVRGKTANADPVKGEVFVKLPPGATEKPKYRWAHAAGGTGVPRGFIRLSEARQLPVGSIFDTRRGTVDLTVARDALGTQTQHAEFSRGQFAWNQSTTKALTTMTMRGGRLKGCKNRKGRKKVSTARRRGRSIFGRGSGSFRTRGSRSTATVRGTTWLQKDTCRGTLTVVREGTVEVKDKAKRRPITISTVQSGKPTRHFARVPKRLR